MEVEGWPKGDDAEVNDCPKGEAAGAVEGCPNAVFAPANAPNPPPEDPNTLPEDAG